MKRKERRSTSIASLHIHFRKVFSRSPDRDQTQTRITDQRAIGNYFKCSQANHSVAPPHSLECQKLLESRIKSNVIYGVPVNGFHPQINASPNYVLAHSQSHINKEYWSKKRKLENQTREVVKQLKIDEEDRIRHRRETSNVRFRENAQKTKKIGNDYKHFICKSDQRNIKRNPLQTQSRSAQKSSNLFEDIFQASVVPQLIANSDGRVIAWNNSFLQMTGYSDLAITKCLSIFCMADHTALPKLFDLFSSVLRDNESLPGTHPQEKFEIPQINHFGSIPREEINSSTPKTKESVFDSKITTEHYDERNHHSCQTVTNGHHKIDSLTIPCRLFLATDTLYKMKITYMSDWDPTRRCFHCFFFPFYQTSGELQNSGFMVNDHISIGS